MSGFSIEPYSWSTLSASSGTLGAVTLDILEPRRLQLALDSRVGCGADEEGVDIVEARDAGVAETLDLVHRHLRDPGLRDIENRRVVGEVEQWDRRDCCQRIIGREQCQSPGTIGNVVVLRRIVLRYDCRPDVLRDGDRFSKGFAP